MSPPPSQGVSPTARSGDCWCHRQQTAPLSPVWEYGQYGRTDDAVSWFQSGSGANLQDLQYMSAMCLSYRMPYEKCMSLETLGGGSQLFHVHPYSPFFWLIVFRWVGSTTPTSIVRIGRSILVAANIFWCHKATLRFWGRACEGRDIAPWSHWGRNWSYTPVN